MTPGPVSPTIEPSRNDGGLEMAEITDEQLERIIAAILTAGCMAGDYAVPSAVHTYVEVREEMRKQELTPPR